MCAALPKRSGRVGLISKHTDMRCSTAVAYSCAARTQRGQNCGDIRRELHDDVGVTTGRPFRSAS